MKFAQIKVAIGDFFIILININILFRFNLCKKFVWSYLLNIIPANFYNFLELLKLKITSQLSVEDYSIKIIQ